MRIYGAKGGGGGSHTPVEAPETGRSKQIVNIVEVISEGEIDGLYDGMKSVYLDNTPVQNADGSYNFNNVSGEINVGTQDQATLAGYESSQNEVSVGVEVKKTTGAIVRTIADERITRLRLTIGVKMLYEQNSQGDTNPTSVDFKIKIGNREQTYRISGKYSSQYLEAVEFGSLPSVPFNISIERITADSSKNTLQNGTLWSAYTEIIDTEFTYPNTALAGVSFDSDYFNGIPARNYLVRGIKVKVPSNYNPETRTYTGLWDGTFKIAWTDNPAWVLFDIVTNQRYGLGSMLGSFGCDKWTLYDIARYCDTMVDDGFGGKEPRFTCNAWITDLDDAYSVLNNICSIFRAIPVWTGSEFSAIIDRPTDPSWVYTNANVQNGKFERSYSAKKSRHNAVKVTYADKNNGYQSAVEYVSDDASIAKNGLNISEITAFGCTSRGQAYRIGRWLIETEKLEKETITFTVGREGLMHLPGDIIRVNDNDYAGLNIGGRIVAVNGAQVTLDREITLSGTSYLTYINNKAQETTIRITSVKGNVVTLASTPTDVAIAGVWALSTEKVTSGLYKAMTLKENEDGTFTVTALQHEPQKEAIVDKSAHFVPTTKTAYRAPQINDVGAKTGYDGKLYITVDIGSGDGKVTYDVRILKDGYLYEYRRGLTDPNISFESLPNGKYTVVIYAKNARGQIVSEKTTTFTIDKPPAPKGVLVTGGLGEITIEWDWVDDVTYTEIFASEDTNFANATKVAKVLSKLYSHSVGAKQTRYYWLRHVRGINNGPFYQEAGIKGESAVDVDEKLDALNKTLSKNIINEVIDTALPARNIVLPKKVTTLTDPTVRQGSDQLQVTSENKLYLWDGAKYKPVETKIAAHSVTATEIAANAVRAEHIAAGELTTDKFVSGLGGNLIYNPILANNAHGSHDNKGSGLVPQTTKLVRRVSNKFLDLLDNENVLIAEVWANTPPSSWWHPYIINTKVTPGKRYCFSAFFDAWHCTGSLVAQELTTAGAWVKNLAVSPASGQTAGVIQQGGLAETTGYIPSSTRRHVFFTAPASGYVSLLVQMANMQTTATLKVARPMLEECTAYSTQPSPWVNSGVTSIHGGSIIAKTVTAQELAANSVTANEIAAGAIAAKHIAANTISATHIVSKGITADKLNVSSLSAISANMGSITAGSMNINNRFIVNSNGDMVANNGSFSGNLKAARGTFAGDISAASGVFKGNIYAANLLDDIANVITVSETKPYAIPARSKRQILMLIPQSISCSPSTTLNEHEGTKWGKWTINTSSSGKYSLDLTTKTYQDTYYVVAAKVFIIPANTSCTVSISVDTDQGKVSIYPYSADFLLFT